MSQAVSHMRGLPLIGFLRSGAACRCAWWWPRSRRPCGIGS